MYVRIDFSKVIPSSQMKGENEEETVQLKEMLEEASEHLSSFTWCQDIESSYFGIGIPTVVGVFLFKILPAREVVDEWVWIVVGDLPPAYITAENCPNPATALDGYIGEMREWVDAAKKGKDVTNLVPVNVPPTQEYAEQLESRLDFLEKKFLVYYTDDLKDYGIDGDLKKNK